MILISEGADTPLSIIGLDRGAGSGTGCGTLIKRKQHSREEIAEKLAQASRLAAEGHLQSEIASTLGISVMTLHRWRHKKSELAAPTTSVKSNDLTAFESELGRGSRGESQQIADLKLENSRLRRLLTDLLLEKMQCLEDLQAQQSPTREPISRAI